MPNQNSWQRVGALALTLLFFGACGSDKNLSPYSELYYDGPYPVIVVADVDPPNDRYQYFNFHIELSDPNLSIVPSQDAWIVEAVTGTYSVDDPGGHILAPPPDLNQTLQMGVVSRSGSRAQITLVTEDWLTDNAAGLIGTTDIATVTLTATFTSHRVRDGLQRSFPVTFSYVLRDEP